MKSAPVSATALILSPIFDSELSLAHSKLLAWITKSNNRTGIPILSHLPLIGDLFSYRDDVYEKTELIIFIRPIVADQASLATDLRKYQIYLPDTQPDVLAPTGLTR